MSQNKKPPAFSPYLAVQKAAEAIDWYRTHLGAEEIYRLTDPTSGKIGHAELLIGGVRAMLSDEYPDFGAQAPQTLGGSPVKFYLNVASADDTYNKLLNAGATSLEAPEDKFFGERHATVADPFGYAWTLAETQNELPPEEAQKRWNEMLAAGEEAS